MKQNKQIKIKHTTYYKLNKTVFQFMDIYRDYRLFI